MCDPQGKNKKRDSAARKGVAEEDIFQSDRHAVKERVPIRQRRQEHPTQKKKKKKKTKNTNPTPPPTREREEKKEKRLKGRGPGADVDARLEKCRRSKIQ